MKRLLHTLILSVSLLGLLPLPAWAEPLLIPGGQVIGLQLQSETVTVAAYDETLGAAARAAGIQPGDQLLRINDIPIASAEDVRRILTTLDGPLALTLRRGSKEQTLSLTPVQTENGPRLGLYLRQGIAGIGTVTFYDPDTRLFGTLGHGVSDGKGSLLNMTRGTAYEAAVQSVKRGKKGDPGQLKGLADPAATFGTLLRNTPQGVFGTANQDLPGQPLPIAGYGDIQSGPAFIRSQVIGAQVQEYDVEILKIYPKTRPDCRNFLLKVTDPQLLEITGGIVQGMSGSPIIQNGKLVGAVTHVLVNDPTTGYGIFIENMLDAAA